MNKLRFPLIVVSLITVGFGAAYGQEAQDPYRKVDIPPLVIGNETYDPQDKIKLGPFRVHPFLNEVFGYNDNILMSDSGPINEYPLVSELGARFDLAHSKQLLLLGYLFRHNEYTKHGWGDYTEQEAELLADFRLGSFFIKMDDSYANLFIPTGEYWNTKARREETKN